jgi:hypothetical protein
MMRMMAAAWTSAAAQVMRCDAIRRLIVGVGDDLAAGSSNKELEFLRLSWQGRSTGKRDFHAQQSARNGQTPLWL